MVTYRTVTVDFSERHYWESVSGRDMWHTLVWYDGFAIQRRTLTSDERSAQVRIKRDSTAIFVIYPMDSLMPKGGGIAPWDGSSVVLHEEEGLLCETLLDATEYNALAISTLDYKGLRDVIPEDFDSDELLYSLADGTFSPSSVKLARRSDVVITAIPTGVYYPESESGVTIVMKRGESVTLSLVPGIHRYYNPVDGLICIAAVTTEGETEFRLYKASPW